jgi:molybdopterin-biosynthesis enzyme MoeA-like protein
MKAEIITIGDEILIGQIIDTNSSWLGQQLSAIGVSVVHRTSVSDNQHTISILLQMHLMLQKKGQTSLSQQEASALPKMM